jgi:PPOX class probable F420-dependent enzyme
MSVKTLSEAQEAILSTTFIAMLSTVRHNDGRISTNPVSFLWEEGEISISTLKNRMKYKNLVANPQATVCIISPHDHMQYVEIRGTVRLVDDPDRSYLRHNFTTLMGVEPPADLDPPDAERVTIYLRPEQVSSPVLYGGRFNRENG